MKKFLFTLMFSLSISTVFAAEDPVQAIRKKDTELQALLKKKTTTAKEKEKIENIYDSVEKLNDAWKDNQEAIRDSLQELNDRIKETRRKDNYEK